MDFGALQWWREYHGFVVLLELIHLVFEVVWVEKPGVRIDLLRELVISNLLIDFGPSLWIHLHDDAPVGHRLEHFQVGCLQGLIGGMLVS